MRTTVTSLAALAIVALCATSLAAHGVAAKDATWLESIDGPAVVPLAYLGAKHMVTGYDHLLFLAGVVFFLSRLTDVLLYASLFTLGHSITLLAGALGGVSMNSYLVDAVIGLSVVYKAFENMGGLRRLDWRVDPRLAVLAFGLIHGFGLATKLQDLSLSQNGLVTNILSFNVGVEIGQALALTFVVVALLFWRTREGFTRHAFAANTALMTGGFVLTGLQLAGFVLSTP